MHKKEKEFSGITISPVFFGTGGLGKLYVRRAEELKREVIKESIARAKRPVVFELGAGRTATPEHIFEPRVWKDLKYDAVQKISYDGILKCFEYGNELFNGCIPQMVSVMELLTT